MVTSMCRDPPDDRYEHGLENMPGDSDDLEFFERNRLVLSANISQARVTGLPRMSGNSGMNPLKVLMVNYSPSTAIFSAFEIESSYSTIRCGGEENVDKERKRSSRG